MTRLVGHRRRGLLVSSPITDEDEDDEPTTETPEDSPAGLAVVFNLDLSTILAGPGARVWLDSVGDLPSDGDRLRLDPIWIANAAARSDVAVFLSDDLSRVVAAARTTRSLADSMGRPRPTLFGGPIIDSEPEASAPLAGRVDGLVVRTEAIHEPEVEGERLRRACASFPDTLLTSLEVWAYAPLILPLASPDALASIPRSALLYALTLEDPGPAARIGGRLLVALDAPIRPWWGKAYLTSGPDTLRWRPWARRPDAVTTGGG